jgi:hypothetical protein
VRFVTEDGSKLAPKVGQEVAVLYDPLNPKEAKIRSFIMLWALPMILTVLGGLLLVPGVLLLSVLVGCEGRIEPV